MSINWDTPISELMHSDTTPPLGLIESDEELMHWKYIKREKKNGKWVYYYDDSAYRNSIAVKDHEIKQKLLKDAEKQYLKDTVNYQVNASKLYQTDWETKKELNDKAYKSTLKLYKARASAEKAAKRYKDAKIRTFAARTISKGVVKLANLLSGNRKKKK